MFMKFLGGVDVGTRKKSTRFWCDLYSHVDRGILFILRQFAIYDIAIFHTTVTSLISILILV